MLSASIVLTFMPMTSSMVFALVGVWSMSRSGYLQVSQSQLLFWLMIAAILLVMSRLSGEKTDIGSVARRYVSIGALAGTMVAVAVGSTAHTVVWGPLAGVLIGTLFLFRSRQIKVDFAALRRFTPALWPVVVTYTLVGITLIGLL